MKRKPEPQRKDKPTLFETHFSIFLGLILAGSALIYILRDPQYRTGSFNDDAIFVIGARDFWHAAASRSVLLKPDYPFPGLPLMLSPLAHLITENWILLESVTVLFTVLLVYVMALWSRKLLTAGEALAATALLAFNPVVARLSGAVMAAVYYTAAVVASLYLLSAWLEKPTLKKALALGFMIGWGCLVRPEGVLLLVSVLGVALFKKRGKALILGMLVPLSGWGVFAWYWFRLREFPASEYGSDLSALTTYWSQHFFAGLQFSGSLFKNLLNDPLLSAKLSSSFSYTVNMGLIIGCLALMTAGWHNLWKQKPGQRILLAAALAFCGLYVAIHLFWHANAARYSIPLLPLIFIFLVRGTTQLLAPLKQHKRLAQGLVAVVLLLDLQRNSQAIYKAYARPNPLNVPPWHCLAWIKTHVPREAGIMSNIAPTIDLYTGRSAIHGIFSANFEWLLYRLMHERLNYLVLRTGNFLTPGVGETQDPNRIWDRVRLWAAHYPQRFQPVFLDPVEQVAVYQIIPDPRFMRAYDLFKPAVALYRADHADSGSRAFRMFNEALAVDPDLGAAHNFLGGMYMDRLDLAHAEAHFLKAIDLVPDDPSAMLNVATVYQIVGDKERSQRYVQRALETAASNGESELWTNNVQALYQDWAQKHGRVFLDAP